MHQVIDGYSFLPIHPNFFISLIKAPGQDYTYLDNTEGNMVHLLNRKIAENSRHWMIAKSPELLEKYCGSFHLEKNDNEPSFQSI